MGEVVGDGDSLRRSIRTRLAFGILPQVSGAAWAGQARGDHRCGICDELIRVRETEYQPHGIEPPAYAHVHCFTIWLMESRHAAAGRGRRPEKAGGTPPIPLEGAG